MPGQLSTVSSRLSRTSPLRGEMLRRFGGRLILVIFSLVVIWTAQGQQRFPPPEFEAGHKLPTTSVPAPRGMLWEYLDVVVLAACLGTATWLIYSRRSRKAVVGLSLFSLAYFGFWKRGCICAIGSLQNVSLSLGDSGYALPVGVLAFFILPIVVALLFGRTFCAAVCPHGALQDLVLLKPLRVPEWLEQGLSVLPFIYLGAGVLFAATGSAFIICQYDPFVPVFRMSGRTAMVLSGVALLVLGVFVGRPYCRFLCPYGALLKMGAIFSKWRVRVTPNHCTQCRLCETSCPLGAMREPQAVERDPLSLKTDRRLLSGLLAALPLLIAAGVVVGEKFSTAAATVNPTVALAQRWVREQNAPSRTGALSPDDLALERARQHPEELGLSARAIQRKVRVGSWIFGAWIGAVIGIKLISLALHRVRTDYEPDAGACFACARCFEFCPNELVRRGIPVLAATGLNGVNIVEASAELEEAVK
jgi:NosR/NirI family transcriptional regulator, nitrous oxide reductase regulator